ncbi:TonB-dependent receptor domain-containing protein [Pedobacter nutrimenti]|uniref:Outer membrane receptor protein involved in Fe transport n=1 Tax=Pedobacter nutrimenti TaxID=1241337 RepID=A0A318V0A8_9SPHI|nr:TonB-dependent receptor [Pedobacter nutrimenti]PYF77279.1 outer membrane receptor protein involved in Fe transport [Pedobacter nutrimenti]
MHKLNYLILVLLLAPVFSLAQNPKVTFSGVLKDAKTKSTIPYAKVVLKKPADSSLVLSSMTDDEGRFVLRELQSGHYLLEISYIGYKTHQQKVSTGTLNAFLDLGHIELAEDARLLKEVNIVSGPVEGVSGKMDKKTFNLSGNISQAGGSVLQALQNLPGLTVQDGKVQLRGSDKVALLIDGKQNAITGFGSQTALDNIPASAIERIEIINNPSAKFDANGNSGIINIIYKKDKQEGFNGKIGLFTGLGALWTRKENLPDLSPQYRATPKINPSLSLNYRKNKLNTFMQADWLYTQTLNRNEFAERLYDDGSQIRQQVKRNRTTGIGTLKTGADWTMDERNTFSISALLSSEKIKDLGEIPYFNADLSQRSRLWTFLEDEMKYTATGSLVYQHKFKQPGHQLNASFNYTFHREDEKYFFDNYTPGLKGEDHFKLLSDEQVLDWNIDYVKPLKQGRLESGIKFRRRTIPTNMQFFPGVNSSIDPSAGGWADYAESIPALYGNYVFENDRFEVEAGLRLEYVKVDYKVNPQHNTYKSDGYDYARPFPNLRLAYKLDGQQKISLFYNGRVDRPNEVDIRIFPKYDEPEVLKVGNPGLRPQFTHTFELGYKNSFNQGSLYLAAYHKETRATITRIATIVPGNTLIYNIFQNAGNSRTTGAEFVLDKELNPWFSLQFNGAVYRNMLDAFSIVNQYPVPVPYHAEKQQSTSGNLKLNALFKLKGETRIQVTPVYLAPDIIPQGKIGSRFSVDMGIKKMIQKGKGELVLNATDLLGTLRIKKSISGNGFVLNSTDYLETQVFRIGYSYKF